MLQTRMGWNVDDPRCGFARWLPVCIRAREIVALFVVCGSEAIVIEDAMALYPSDELVTKLRMLENKIT